MQDKSKVSSGEPTYEVVWPLGRTVLDAVRANPPISDLNGKTVGELWDWLFRGDEIFPLIREKLRRRYPGIKFVDYTQFGNTHGLDGPKVLKTIPDLMRKHACDIVISGVGA